MFRGIICVDDFLLILSMECYLQDSLEAVTKKGFSLTNTLDPDVAKKTVYATTINKPLIIFRSIMIKFISSHFDPNSLSLWG